MNNRDPTPSDKKTDYATAIMTNKKRPNKLMVEDSNNDDNSVVEMTAAKMEELKIYRGDTVIIKGIYIYIYIYI